MAFPVGRADTRDGTAAEAPVSPAPVCGLVRRPGAGEVEGEVLPHRGGAHRLVEEELAGRSAIGIGVVSSTRAVQNAPSHFLPVPHAVAACKRLRRSPARQRRAIFSTEGSDERVGCDGNRAINRKK